MSNVTEAALANLFASKLDTEAGREKIAALGSDYVRDRLREESFARQILPPKTCKPSELQVSVNHDTLVKIVEIEPQSRAMTMTFRDQPTVSYVRGDRMEVPFHTVGSERYEKTTQELMAYRFNIMEVIRRNVVIDIQEVEDYRFLTHVESAVQSLQKDALINISGNPLSMAFTSDFGNATAFTAYNVNNEGGGTAVPEVGKCKANDVLFQAASSPAASAAAGLTQDIRVPVQKDDFIKLAQLFPGNGGTASRLELDQVLITSTDFEDLAGWTISEVGELARETTVDGYKMKTVVGRRYIKTLKTDILRPGNIYGFTAPQFLGGFLVLNKTQFYADKERNRVSFEAWEDIAIYIANVAGCRKLELYAGSTDAGVSGVQTDYAPVSEKSLGRKNNLVDEGQFFPQVDSF